MHDFGLTENYLIIMDLPFYYDPKKMLEQGTWIYSFSKKKSRFGILPRYAKSEEGIKWFEFDRTFFIFHNGNSWEEDEDTLVLICIVLEPLITTKVSEEVKEIDNPEHRVDNLFSTLAHDEAENICEIFFKPPLLFSGRNADGIFTGSKLFKLTFNIKTGKAHEFALSSEGHFEYPKINESYIGRKSKYLYLSEINEDAKIPSIVKYDLEGNFETKLNFEEGKYGSEVAFVSQQPLTLLEEDDGFLTTFVHDEKNSVSFAYVISAKQMEVLAKIELPSRVPYGFHATFVTKEELLEAKKTVTIQI